MKKTVVLGATDNPSRYAYLAVQRLKKHGHEVVPVGLREGEVEGLRILKGQPDVANVDTVTLYVGPRNQQSLYDYILKLNPKRVIFNPGTENPELERMVESKGIEALHACTLVMLSTGEY
jgi:predicted CoA-binding protein